MRPLFHLATFAALSLAAVQCEGAHADLPQDAGSDVAQTSSSSSGGGGGDEVPVSGDDGSSGLDSGMPSEGGGDAVDLGDVGTSGEGGDGGAKDGETDGSRDGGTG